MCQYFILALPVQDPVFYHQHYRSSRKGMVSHLLDHKSSKTVADEDDGDCTMFLETVSGWLEAINMQTAIENAHDIPKV